MLDWFSANHTNEDAKNESSAAAAPPTTTPFLMEVVSARDICRKRTLLDPGEVDPYCIVRLNNSSTILHQTNTIYNDSDPIWTVKTKSLCLLELPLDENDDNDDAILVEVCHGSQCLGVVRVSLPEIYKSNGERHEYPIRVSEQGRAADTDNDGKIQVGSNSLLWFR